METSIQTTDLLIAAIDLELKLLLQAEVSLFKASKQAIPKDDSLIK